MLVASMKGREPVGGGWFRIGKDKGVLLKTKTKTRGGDLGGSVG